MTRLLVSVRNALEAEAALAGGAHVIDVKEPSRGSLGRADDATITEVVRVVAGRRPVSAALGELRYELRDVPEYTKHLQFLKWGLSQYRAVEFVAWAALMSQLRHIQELSPQCEIVGVAYADGLEAMAPPFEEVLAFLVAARQRVLLLDTFTKDGRTLLDWLDETTIERMVKRCQSAGIHVALAGSLGFDEIRALKHLQPDWFAVRGAACQGQQRNAAIEAGRVRQLVELIDAT